MLLVQLQKFLFENAFHCNRIEKVYNTYTVIIQWGQIKKDICEIQDKM